MRLSVIGDEVSQELSEVIELCQRHAYSGVEIRSVWNRGPTELTRADCERIRTALEEGGLQVAAFASPVFKTDLPTSPAALRTARKTLDRSLERAWWLRASMVRVFSFYRSEQPEPERAAEVVATLLTGVDLPAGTRLLLENGTRTHTPTTDHLLRFFDAAPELSLGVVWDPGNAVYCGLEPEPFPRGYERLRGRIEHVHVKDPIDDSHYARLGEGRLPWPEIVARLAADSYRGWLSLETHWRPGRVLSPHERDVPWGVGYSEGGLEASEESMAVLRRLVGPT